MNQRQKNVLNYKKSTVIQKVLPKNIIKPAPSNEKSNKTSELEQIETLCNYENIAEIDTNKKDT